MKTLLLMSLLGVAGFAQADGVLAGLGAKALAAGGVSPGNPVLVLAPNAPLNISGKVGGVVVRVVGNDHCPNDWMDNLTGKPIESGCVVLDKPLVTVHYKMNGKAVTEQWSVKKAGDRTSLVRPDGTLVSQAN